MNDQKPTPALDRLLARATKPIPVVTWEKPGDLSRMSIEAMESRGRDQS